ncbi:MAG: hypothetical protein J0I14_06800 [Propionibacteriaceae bacterium]|jgi:hypothetical protein|nr:hypothetical protein [Propionibacteriaceae bacterium]
MSFLKSTSRYWRGLRLAALPAAVVALAVVAATPASAAGVSFTGSATLNSGQSRAIAAAWGNKPPYDVNFQCNVPGCANFVKVGTTTTGLGRSVVMTVCSRTTKTHEIYISEKGGGEVYADSKTTWRAGSYC